MNDLETNKINAALLRDAELDIARRAELPIDLRTVPREQWDQFLDRDIAIPPPFVDGEFILYIPTLLLPIPEKAVHETEEAMERWHGVTAPYFITMSLTLQQTGRAWSYIEAAAPYLTGLTLGKHDIPPRVASLREAIGPEQFDSMIDYAEKKGLLNPEYGPVQTFPKTPTSDFRLPTSP